MRPRKTTPKFQAESTLFKTRSKKRISKPSLLIILFGCVCIILARFANFYSSIQSITSNVAVSDESTLASKQILDCKSLIQADSKHYRDNGQLFFRKTTTRPPFFISLHNQTIDHVRWNTIMEKGYYYETGMYLAIHESLKPFENNPRDAIVLDIGGNIGWFTLIAASLGHRVLTFEPNRINNIKHCESLHMNGWLHEDRKDDLVELYESGVGDKHGEELKLFHFPGKRNPGKATFNIARRGTGRVVGSFTLLSLDQIAEDKGWFESRPTIAFVKVDVEGFELNVMRGAKRMIDAKLIRNVVFEFKPQIHDEDEENKKLLKNLIDNNYVMYKYGGANGPHDLFERKYNTAEELFTILSERMTNQNLWWRLRE